MKSLKLQRELLQQISSVLSAKPGARQDPLRSVLEILAEFRPYDAVTLYLHADDQVFLLAHVGAESPVAVGAASSIPAVVRSGEPTISHSESQATPAAGKAKSQAVVPIRRGIVSVGALVLTSHHAYVFGSTEMAMLKTVARRMAIFFATKGRHYLRNLRARPQSDQSDTVTAAVA